MIGRLIQALMPPLPLATRHGAAVTPEAHQEILSNEPEKASFASNSADVEPALILHDLPDDFENVVSLDAGVLTKPVVERNLTQSLQPAQSSKGHSLRESFQNHASALTRRAAARLVDTVRHRGDRDVLEAFQKFLHAKDAVGIRGMAKDLSHLCSGPCRDQFKLLLTDRQSREFVIQALLGRYATSLQSKQLTIADLPEIFPATGQSVQLTEEWAAGLLIHGLFSPDIARRSALRLILAQNNFSAYLTSQDPVFLNLTKRLGPLLNLSGEDFWRNLGLIVAVIDKRVALDQTNIPQVFNEFMHKYASRMAEVISQDHLHAAQIMDGLLREMHAESPFLASKFIMQYLVLGHSNGQSVPESLRAVMVRHIDVASPLFWGNVFDDMSIAPADQKQIG